MWQKKRNLLCKLADIKSEQNSSFYSTLKCKMQSHCKVFFVSFWMSKTKGKCYLFIGCFCIFLKMFSLFLNCNWETGTETMNKSPLAVIANCVKDDYLITGLGFERWTAINTTKSLKKKISKLITSKSDIDIDAATLLWHTDKPNVSCHSCAYTLDAEIHWTQIPNNVTKSSEVKTLKMAAHVQKT